MFRKQERQIGCPLAANLYNDWDNTLEVKCLANRREPWSTGIVQEAREAFETLKACPHKHTK
jgi:hypothetical protein